MAHSKPTIARARGCSAFLDVIDDGLRIWFRGEGRPMGIIPSAFLPIPRDGETRIKRCSKSWE